MESILVLLNGSSESKLISEPMVPFTSTNPNTSMTYLENSCPIVTRMPTPVTCLIPNPRLKRSRKPRPMPRRNASNVCHTCSLLAHCCICVRCHGLTLATTLVSCARSCRILACSATRLLSQSYCTVDERVTCLFDSHGHMPYRIAFRITRRPFVPNTVCTDFRTVRGRFQSLLVVMLCFFQAAQLLGLLASSMLLLIPLR